MNKICGIYKITNLVNNKIYIGASINIKNRFKCHKVDLNRNKHRNIYLQRSWIKYGKDSFKFEIIFLCNIQDLENAEIYFIDKLNSIDKNIGYNIKNGGSHTSGKDHPSYGIPVPEERKKKIREARAKQVVTQNMLNALSNGRMKSDGLTGKKHPAYGCKHSSESIRKTAEAKFKPVYKIDLNNGEILEEFNSIKSASILMGFKNNCNISECCRGKRKSCGGFAWVYK